MTHFSSNHKESRFVKKKNLAKPSKNYYKKDTVGNREREREKEEADGEKV